MAFQLFLYLASESLSCDPERKAKRCESHAAIEQHSKVLQSEATCIVQVFRAVCSQRTHSTQDCYTQISLLGAQVREAFTGAKCVPFTGDANSSTAATVIARLIPKF